jgi:hypothetical protein
MQHENSVCALLNPERYRNLGRTEVFPSESSLQWFIRKHKDRLINCGALLAPTSRKLINPPSFDEVVLAVGLLVDHGGQDE